MRRLVAALTHAPGLWLLYRQTLPRSLWRPNAIAIGATLAAMVTAALWWPDRAAVAAFAAWAVGHVLWGLALAAWLPGSDRRPPDEDSLSARAPTIRGSTPISAPPERLPPAACPEADGADMRRVLVTLLALPGCPSPQPGSTTPAPGPPPSPIDTRDSGTATPAPDTGGGGWCAGKDYLDIHVHTRSAPRSYHDVVDGRALFEAELDTAQAEAEAHGGSALVLVNLDGARWFSESTDPDRWDRLLIGGIIRPHAVNEGFTTSAGHSYPAATIHPGSGDPLDHVDLYKAYGVRAIKILSKLAASGLDPDEDGQTWVGHCDPFDGSLPRPVENRDVAHHQTTWDALSDPAHVHCADYDDDQVEIGHRTDDTAPTFYRYVQRAAMLGLNVVAHGEQRTLNERTGTEQMGWQTFVRLYDKIKADPEIPQADRDAFELLMYHGPTVGLGPSAALLDDPGARAAFNDRLGLWWGVGGFALRSQARDLRGVLYEDASDRDERLAAMTSHLQGMEDARGSMVYGSDAIYQLEASEHADAGISPQGAVLMRDIAQTPAYDQGQFTEAILCERAASFLRLE